MLNIVKKDKPCGSLLSLIISVIFTVQIFINVVIAGTLPPHTKIFSCQAFPATQPTSLCVIQPDNSYPHWYLISEAQTRLVKINNTEPQISSFSISHSGNFIAIESVAEGHPMVQVYDTHLLLTRNHVEFLQGWGTPPGWINAGEWNGDVLSIKSNIPHHQKYNLNIDFPENVTYHLVWSIEYPELKLIETDSSE